MQRDSCNGRTIDCASSAIESKWGLTLGRRSGPWVHRECDRPHCDQAVAMSRPKVVVSRTGQSEASHRGSADHDKRSERAKRASEASHDLTPREGDAERRGGWGQRVGRVKV